MFDLFTITINHGRAKKIKTKNNFKWLLNLNDSERWDVWDEAEAERPNLKKNYSTIVNGLKWVYVLITKTVRLFHESANLTR